VARRAAQVLVLATLLLALVAARAAAHAGLSAADPPPGAALGASPTALKLTFSERPDAPLSRIAITDRAGRIVAGGAGQPAAGDPLSIVLPLNPLRRGVYTVSWRVDSEVDGHATTGKFSFGVQVPASLIGAPTRATVTPVSSGRELLARWLLLAGLIGLLGAAGAAAARFGDGARGELVQAAGAWVLALVGLLLLTDAQRISAGVSLSALLDTPVGHALIWRAVAVGAAGLAVLAGLRFRQVQRAALISAGAAALAAVVVHVANGHAAAAGSWPPALTVLAQSLHVALAGVWIGGLLALVVGLRLDGRAERTSRFARVAALALILIVATGTLRAFSELRAWHQLWSTGYGRAVLGKFALVALAAVVAIRNTRIGAPALRRGDARPLRIGAGAELCFGISAVAVAALLGTLAPPVSGQTARLEGLTASGTDTEHTVRVTLSTASNEPGPNLFDAHVSDYRSGDPISSAVVRLLFTPLDDPGVASSSLPLLRSGGGRYTATGPNLTFDGRWGVRVLISRSTGATEVPLELDPIGPPQQISIERVPGQPPKYTKLDPHGAFVRISPRPERAGPSELFVNFYSVSFGGELATKTLVVTLRAGDGPTVQLPMRRTGTGSFVGDLRLAAGRDEIAVIAHARFGARLRSVFDLSVPAR
jgi:copper transport protein